MFDSRLQEPVQILSVNPIDQRGKVEADARKFDLPYPVLCGRNSKIADAYKINSLPCLVIVDRDGRVAFYKSFAKADEIEQILDGLLKGTP